MTSVNFTKYGFPQKGWYNVENGIQTFYNDAGASQRKAYLDNQIIREYTGFSQKSPNTLTVIQPKNGIKGEFEIIEDIASKEIGQGKKRNFLLRGVMNEHGDVVQITKNEKFLEGMVENGKSYPNSARRVAKKCLEFFKYRI